MFVTFAMGTFGMLPAVAQNPEVYAITRFLAGFGDGGDEIIDSDSDLRFQH